MAEKRSWPLTNSGKAILALYLGIAGLILSYGRELYWSAKTLPGYLREKIHSPPERQWVHQALEMMDEGESPPKVGELLEKSIAVDPNTEAVYWLGEHFYMSGQFDRALDQFSKSIEIDPTMPDAYIKSARIFEKKKERKRAQKVLQAGLSYFSENAEKYRPRKDNSFGWKYNEKAERTYEQHKSSLKKIAEELVRFNRPESGPQTKN